MTAVEAACPRRLSSQCGEEVPHGAASAENTREPKGVGMENEDEEGGR